MKKSVYILAVFLILSTMVGCSQKSSKEMTVKVGFFPNITHTQALFGKESKFKSALGENNIDWKQFNAGSSEIEALLAGAIDIGYIGPGPAII